MKFKVNGVQFSVYWKYEESTVKLKERKALKEFPVIKTNCIIEIEGSNKPVARGSAKCGPHDTFLKAEGRKRSFLRAVDNFIPYFTSNNEEKRSIKQQVFDSIRQNNEIQIILMR